MNHALSCYGYVKSQSLHFEDGNIYRDHFYHQTRDGKHSGDRVLVLGIRAKTVALTNVMGLKDHGQPFRKELPNTIKSRFDGFWSASQNLADLSVRKIFVRK